MRRNSYIKLGRYKLKCLKAELNTILIRNLIEWSQLFKETYRFVYKEEILVLKYYDFFENKDGIKNFLE
jgi:hypothetical protein